MGTNGVGERKNKGKRKKNFELSKTTLKENNELFATTDVWQENFERKRLDIFNTLLENFYFNCRMLKLDEDIDVQFEVPGELTYNSKSLRPLVSADIWSLKLQSH